MTEACENCRFFRVDPSNMKQGKCHQRSPVCHPYPAGMNQIAFASSFPPVMREEWCGDYEENDNG